MDDATTHGLTEGVELTDTNTGTELTVRAVLEDGKVVCRAWVDGRDGREYTNEVWTESEIVTAMDDGIFVRATEVDA